MPADLPPHNPETGEILTQPTIAPPAPPAEETGEALWKKAAREEAARAEGAAVPAPAAPPPAAAQAAEKPAEKPTPRPRTARPRPSSTDELEGAITEAQGKLDEASSAGAFARDPYRIALTGLSLTIGVFPSLVRRIETRFSALSAEVAAGVRSLRHPLTDAERAAVQRDVVDAAREGVKNATSGIADGLAAEARAKLTRQVAMAFGAAVLAVAAAGVGGYYGGRSSAQAEVQAWVAAQRADLTLADETLRGLPVAEARAWANLIRANPAVREALAKAKDRGTDPAGRPYGALPVWLDVARLPPTR